MKLLLTPILLPLIAGLFQMLIPSKERGLHRWMLMAGATATFAVSVFIFFSLPRMSAPLIRLDNFAAFILMACGFFSFLISLYSMNFFPQDFNFKEFSIYSLWTLGSAGAIALSNNFIFFTVAWGFLALMLYMLVNIMPDASSAAKKTLVIVGGTDSLLVLGIAIVSYMRGNWDIAGQALPVSGLSITAFLCLALAALAKAGALPVHTWIPDVAEKAPVPVSALLPASLDKLLGIYFLVRIVTNIFVPNAFTTYFLLIIGALTIIVAVMMALIQHDLKRLLGYHAVSQVGYMVVGIGTGNLAGVIGGLFHMLNHALYKSTLFLSGGAIEKQAGTAELSELGGLSKVMPLTFIGALTASMSISGIPPLNGFVSKWLIYQGLIQSFVTSGSWISMAALLAAMFGSALTLASFVKFLHAAFLASPKRPTENITEVKWTMWVPIITMSALCLVFGIFAFQIPIPCFIANSVAFNQDFSTGPIGFWQPGLATALVILGLFAGLIVYFLFMRSGAVRRDSAFVGGENIPGDTYPPGTDFYKTIQDFGFFKFMFKAAQNKAFDLYDTGLKASSYAGSWLSKAQSGLLSSYLLWSIAGLIILFWLLV